MPKTLKDLFMEQGINSIPLDTIVYTEKEVKEAIELIIKNHYNEPEDINMANRLLKKLQIK